MSLVGRIIRRPIGTLLLALALAVCGVISYLNLPVAPLPNLGMPFISVSASLPGASPETMASSVATPLQRALGSIAGLETMHATNTEGSTRITLQFKLNKDVNDAAREVQAAINQAVPLLPSSMRTPPRYRKLNPASAPIIVLTLTSEVHSLGHLYDLADSLLAQKLSQVAGVGEVTVGGSARLAVRVDVNPMQLNRYGISLEEVRTAINQANRTSPRGVVENDHWRWMISTNGRLSEAQEYRDVVIRWHEGQAVRLGDIATVYDAVENENNFGFFNNEPAVNIIVRRQESANIIATVDRIKAELPRLNALLPPQVTLHVAQDRSPSIRATLHEAEWTLLLAVVLVVLVVLAFLRNWRATLIPAISVPVSLLVTFVVMLFLGFTLNSFSLMALIVVTGFVVDDSIVVLENISRYLERGFSPYEAARRGTREVAFTVVSMSLSLVVVFVPLLLVGDLVGRLFYEFGLTLSTAVLVSLVVSLTLTPTLSALWLKPIEPKRPESDPQRSESEAPRSESTPPRPELEPPTAQALAPTHLIHLSRLRRLVQELAQAVGSGMARAYEWILTGYKRSLGWVLQHPVWMVLVLILNVGLTAYLFITLPKAFFPHQDTGVVRGFFRVDEGTSFEAMLPRLETYRQIILEDPDVEAVSGFVGGRGGSTSSMMTIQLVPFEERESSAQEVIQRLRQQLTPLPGTRLFLVAVQDIRVGGGPQPMGDYQYLFKSGDMGLLREWMDKARVVMAQLPELRDVSDESEQGATRLELHIDRELAQRLGVEMRQVTNLLNDLYGSRRASTIYEALNQYYVVLGAADEFSREAAVLDALQVITDDGRAVPLNAFTEVRYGNAPMRVNQQDGALAEAISFNLAPGVTLAQADAAVRAALDSIYWPSRLIEVGFDRTGEAFQKLQRQQPLLLLSVVLLLYLVLGVLYESYLHPITILSTLPSAGLGALLALKWVGMDFSVIALIGLFLLMGIVKKNAIILIDFALQRQRQQQLSARQAIYEACLVRFRPIVMTTLAAISGAVPLIIATGAGVEMRQPLGVTIVGGLVVTQLLTLYTTPVVYLLLERVAQRHRFKLQRRRWGVKRIHDHKSSE